VGSVSFEFYRKKVRTTNVKTGGIAAYGVRRKRDRHTPMQRWGILGEKGKARRFAGGILRKGSLKEGEDRIDLQEKKGKRMPKHLQISRGDRAHQKLENVGWQLLGGGRVLVPEGLRNTKTEGKERIFTGVG